MNDKTVLNPAVAQPADERTVLNKAVLREEGLRPGMRLKNGLTILERLNVESGEADLYLCDYKNKMLVLKHYRHAQSLKEEVMKKLTSIRSEYVAQVYKVGTLLDRNYELDQYFPLGSLEGKRIPYETLKEKIIPQLNEALKALHDKRLFHKDLKPSNIMLRTEQYDIALIDFGISSVLETDSTVLLTQTGMTPQYAAPETMQGLYSRESDYYSMGVTLCALYQGRSPFHGMNAQQISRFIAMQQLPLPEDMPVDLQELIRGLTYVDVSHRNDLDNPNRRWTYAEVKKWLAGERQPIPGNPNGAFLKEAEFAGKRFSDQAALTEEMILQWEYGKRQLINGELAAMFRRCSPSAAPLCALAQSRAKEYGGYDDLAYFFLLYELMPKKDRFVWRGKSYENTVALGNDMLSRLQTGDSTRTQYYHSILRQGILSAFARINDIGDNPQTIAIRAAETEAVRTDLSDQTVKRLHYRVAYILSGQKKLCVGGESFFSLEALSAHMQALADRSIERFLQFSHELIQTGESLDPQFEIWMEVTGHKQALDAWRQNLTQ